MAKSSVAGGTSGIILSNISFHKNIAWQATQEIISLFRTLLQICDKNGMHVQAQQDHEDTMTDETLICTGIDYQ